MAFCIRALYLTALLRGDSASRAEFYAKLFNIGAMSQNDVR